MPNSTAQACRSRTDREVSQIDIFASKWFAIFAGVIIACSIFTVFWTSFVEESDIEFNDAVKVIAKVIFFIPLLILGGILIAVEKRRWGVIIAAVVILTMLVAAFILDPGESPAPWD